VEFPVEFRSDLGQNSQACNILVILVSLLDYGCAGKWTLNARVENPWSRCTINYTNCRKV